MTSTSTSPQFTSYHDFISFLSGQKEPSIPPYTLHALNYEQLPDVARQVLVDNGVIKSNVKSFDETKIVEIQRAHFLDFRYSLEGLQAELIHSRRRSARLAQLETLGDEEWKVIDGIVWDLRERIIPEWHSALARYVTESDSLVWLKAQSTGVDEEALLADREKDIEAAFQALIDWVDQAHEAGVGLEFEQQYIRSHL